MENIRKIYTVYCSQFFSPILASTVKSL